MHLSHIVARRAPGDMAMTIRMAAIAALVVLTAAPAAAQNVPSITVRPLDSQVFGGDGYTGPYRDLPGVAMFRGRTAPGRLADRVRLPSYNKIPGEYTRTNPPLPVLDGWHGSLSEGIPF